ncbi:hypothetical protein TYRP_009059 [Tyrophagus putrescentiae]|nr:hypothetical protein TYRP_009059 [Tyrophagus putrescentiae]
MARGIDITRLDLNTLQDDSFRATLIEFSCEDEDRKWSMGGVDKVFWKTDQVSGANPVPGGTMVSETVIAESSEELKNSMAAKVSLEADVPLGGFSVSAGAKMSEESKFQKKSLVAETTAFVSAFQVDFYLPKQLFSSLSRSFTDFFDAGTPVKKYINDTARYDDFVSTFGTHYFTQASLGGYMSMKTGIISGGAEYEKAKEKSGENFNKATKITFAYLGGDPVSIDLDSQKPNEYLTEWTKTVLVKPHLFKGRLRGMEELVENPELRVEVKKAIRIYMIRAYLDEILRIVNMITTLETEAQFAELEAGIRNFMRYVLMTAKGRPALVKMLRGWDAQLEVADCRRYVTDSCSSSTSNRTFRALEAKLDNEAQGVCSKVEQRLADPSWENYTECLALIKEGREMTVKLAKPLEGCGADQACHRCHRLRAEEALHFCQSEAAIDVRLTALKRKLSSSVDQSFEVPLINETEVGRAVRAKYDQIFGKFLKQ